MSFYQVLKRFELLSGLQGDELSRYSQLCRQAAEEIRERLTVSESTLSDGEKLRLSYTAAALAYYKYCLYTSASQPVSFSAGEVSVNMGSQRLESAKKIFDEEYAGLCRVLKPRDFYFGRFSA